MAKLLVNAKRSAILVTVLSIIGSCAQNVTNATTDNATTVTESMRNTTLTILTEPDVVTHSVGPRKTSTPKSDRSNVTDDGARTEGTISIEPLPDGIELPPAAMMLIAGITCGVIVVVFFICYVATMMNLCICKFLMHECPSGRFKDDEKNEKEEKKGKKKKGKGDDGKETPAPEEPSPPGP